jgi:hypothetical protein
MPSEMTCEFALDTNTLTLMGIGRVRGLKMVDWF